MTSLQLDRRRSVRAGGGIGDGCGAVALKPGRVQFASSHLPHRDDFEGTLAEFERRRVTVVCQVIVDQVVETVDLPVEFFLEGDHLTTQEAGRRTGVSNSISK